MPPTILITRPEMAGLRFADQVRARFGCGVSIILSPVMKIEYISDLPDLNPFRTLVFTSRNGVTAFSQATGRRDIPCYCVGDATAASARDEGMNAVSCGGDADTLVARILAEKPPGSYLHIRGEHVASNVAERLTSAGLPTTDTVMYRQVPEDLTVEAKARLQGEEYVVLPLFSPRSAKLTLESTQILAPLAVIALSEKVAAQVPAAYAGTVSVAELPTAEEMLRKMEDWIGAGKPLEGKNLAQ